MNQIWGYSSIISRTLFLKAIARLEAQHTTAYGSGTSIVCRELMQATDAWFPEAQLNADKIAVLALAGHTVLYFVAKDADSVGDEVRGSRLGNRQHGRKPKSWRHFWQQSPPK